MTMHYESNIETRACPVCGKQRPLDWFANKGGRCWKCRRLAWKGGRSPAPARKRPHGKCAKGDNDDLIG